MKYRTLPLFKKYAYIYLNVATSFYDKSVHIRNYIDYDLLRRLPLKDMSINKTVFATWFPREHIDSGIEFVEDLGFMSKPPSIYWHKKDSEEDPGPLETEVLLLGFRSKSHQKTYIEELNIYSSGVPTGIDRSLMSTFSPGFGIEVFPYRKTTKNWDYVPSRGYIHKETNYDTKNPFIAS